LPIKDPEIRKIKQRIATANWYLRNKEKHQAAVAINKRRYREAWFAYKENLKCHFCGFQHPAAIDFHHVDRKDKRDINRLVANSAFKRAIEEVETKCIPVCSNCHRIHHWEERRAQMQDRRERRKELKELRDAANERKPDDHS